MKISAVRGVGLGTALSITSAFAGAGSIEPATGGADISIRFTYPPTSGEIADIKASLSTFVLRQRMSISR